MGRGLSISFDLDGTLTTHRFAEGVWHEALPLCISQQRGISFSSAKKMCMDAYGCVGESSIEWYQLTYWLDFFDLKDISRESLIFDNISKISLFDDVIPCLRQLKTDGYSLIMFSNASRDFLDIEVSYSNLKPYFDTVISLSDDWGMVKSDPSAFERLQALIGTEIIHIGDHVSFDCRVPRSAGMDAYHIWRGSGERMNDSLVGLDEVLSRILCDKE
jgi:HAD superfamily hydrolase (TIGR01549 family)